MRERKSILTIRLEPALRRKLDDEARAQERPLAWIIAKIIKAKLEPHNEAAA